ncbi:MAG: hypothetical protein ACOCTP_00640 [Roseicyclus sp.]
MIFGLFLAAAALFAAPGPARAEMVLMMFEEPGCVWCRRWTEEVGGEYPITPEGRAAPLERVQLRDALPEGITLASQPRFTPTFVVLRDGTEVGRIEGYPGEDFFWGLLGRILDKAAPDG